MTRLLCVKPFHFVNTKQLHLVMHHHDRQNDLFFNSVYIILAKLLRFIVSLHYNLKDILDLVKLCSHICEMSIE